MAVKQMAALKYYVIWSHGTVYVKLFEKSETTSDKCQFSNVSNFYLPLHTLYLPLSVSACDKLKLAEQQQQIKS